MILKLVAKYLMPSSHTAPIDRRQVRECICAITPFSDSALSLHDPFVEYFTLHYGLDDTPMCSCCGKNTHTNSPEIHTQLLLSHENADLRAYSDVEYEIIMAGNLQRESKSNASSLDQRAVRDAILYLKFVA